MNIVVRSFRLEDAKAFSELVIRVFNQFVAPGYSQEGRQTFYDYLVPNLVIERVRMESIQFY